MADNFRRSGLRRGFSGPRGARRATEWTGTLEAAVTFTGVGAGAKSLLLTADQLAPSTIVRTRGIVTLKSDQFAASEDQIGALGVAVVTTTAAGVGVTAMPGPMSDESSDKFYVLEMFGNTMQLGSAVGFDPRFGITREIDSKAMRKVDNEETLVVIWENGVNGNAVAVLVNLRTLFKLH